LLNANATDPARAAAIQIHRPHRSRIATVVDVTKSGRRSPPQPKCRRRALLLERSNAAALMTILERGRRRQRSADQAVASSSAFRLDAQLVDGLPVAAWIALTSEPAASAVLGSPMPPALPRSHQEHLDDRHLRMPQTG